MHGHKVYFGTDIHFVNSWAARVILECNWWNSDQRQRSPCDIFGNPSAEMNE